MHFLKKFGKRILQYEAKFILKKYKPKIIAIVGSVGKTLTRETIYLVLSKKFFVRKNEKSFTANLGIALTIIGYHQGVSTILQFLKSLIFGFKLLIFNVHYPQVLILEIDVDNPGDLGRAFSLFSPDVLVMTAIGDVPSHVELFNNTEDFLSEKRKYIKSLNKEVIVIYNADDGAVSNILQDLSLIKISCSIGSGYFDIKGSESVILYGNGKSGSMPIGMSFDIKYGMEVNSIKIFNSIGISNEYACLLSYAVGIEFGLSRQEIIDSLNDYRVLQGRMRLIPGLSDSLLIDDSYNSSPIAMEQAILVFAKLKCRGRKIAIIGDMLELGRYSSLEHKKLAQLLKDVADNVICVGLRSRRVYQSLLFFGFNKLDVISVDTSKEAVVELQKILKSGDIVLVKGSQAMRMERILEKVMKHEEDKNQLLVRQESEWLSRT